MKAWWHLQRLRWRRNRTAWLLRRCYDGSLAQVYEYQADAVRMAEEGRWSDRPPWRY
jgi:hypothetical protein